MAEFWYRMVKEAGYPLERVPAKYREIVEKMLEDDEE